MDSKMYGYARVSSREQHLDRQIDALLEFGVEPKQIYKDKASGKDFIRPQYTRLLKRLKKDDVLIIKSIDRLGRNYDEILEQWRKITKEKQAYIVVLDMPLLDTRQTRDGVTGVFIADLMLQLLSYVSQIERENIRQRQAEGIAAAHARGVKFGRPKIEKPKNFSEVVELFNNGEISRKEAVSRVGVSSSTFNRWLEEERESEND